MINRTFTFLGKVFQPFKLQGLVWSIILLQTINKHKLNNSWLLRVHSLLLTQSRLVSFPSNTKMFQFLELLLKAHKCIVCFVIYDVSAIRDQTSSPQLCGSDFRCFTPYIHLVYPSVRCIAFLFIIIIVF